MSFSMSPKPDTTYPPKGGLADCQDLVTITIRAATSVLSSLVSLICYAAQYLTQPILTNENWLIAKYWTTHLTQPIP